MKRRMKYIRNITTTLACIMMLCPVLTGCGNSSAAGSRTDGTSSSVEDVLAQGMAEADAEADDGANPYSASGSDSGQKLILTPTPYDYGEESEDDAAAEDAVDPAEAERLEREALAAGTEGIDIDLTLLSSTMVYSQVYDMMSYPEKYVGKTVRMSGVYTDFYDETADKHYFACIIQDATACCAQGIEFELTDDYKYPDDYPKDSDLITVTGVFDTYMEGESMYVTLRNA
ncbi:MAG: hypothetical protein K5673_03365, partial [Lachnospiraceae bacterium]|nr:hypothetical protein [Lachnospiraceae bacterium]